MKPSRIAYRLGHVTDGRLHETFPELVVSYREMVRLGRRTIPVHAVCLRNGIQIGVSELLPAQSAQLRAIRLA